MEYPQIPITDADFEDLKTQTGQFLTEAESLAEDFAKAKEILVFFGLTGTGKSTTALMMTEPEKLDITLIANQNVEPVDLLDDHEAACEYKIASKQGAFFTIGEGNSSTTEIPKVFVENDRVIIDLPGVFDTNAWKKTLMCIFSSQKIFQLIANKPTRTVFFNSASAVEDLNGSVFIYGLKRVINWLYTSAQTKEAIVQNFAFVFTNQSKNSTCQTHKTKLINLVTAQKQISAYEREICLAVIESAYNNNKVIFLPPPNKKLCENNYPVLCQKRILALFENASYEARPFKFNPHPDVDPKIINILNIIKDRTLADALTIVDECTKKLTEFYPPIEADRIIEKMCQRTSRWWLMQRNSNEKICLGIGCFYIYRSLRAVFNNEASLFIDLDQLNNFKQKHNNSDVVTWIAIRMERITKIISLLKPVHLFFKIEGEFYNQLTGQFEELERGIQSWKKIIGDNYNVWIDLENVESENLRVKPSFWKVTTWFRTKKPRALALQNGDDHVVPEQQNGENATTADYLLGFIPLTLFCTNPLVWTPEGNNPLNLKFLIASKRTELSQNLQNDLSRLTRKPEDHDN